MFYPNSYYHDIGSLQVYYALYTAVRYRCRTWPVTAVRMTAETVVTAFATVDTLLMENKGMWNNRLWNSMTIFLSWPTLQRWPRRLWLCVCTFECALRCHTGKYTIVDLYLYTKHGFVTIFFLLYTIPIHKYNMLHNNIIYESMSVEREKFQPQCCEYFLLLKSRIYFKYFFSDQTYFCS